MNEKPVVIQTSKDLDDTKEQLSDRELLVTILRSQMMLNSKMFEFIRNYQEDYDYTRDRIMLKDSCSHEPKVRRLFKEVNEIGVNLSKAVSVFIGENLYEKRDEQGRVVVFCKICQKESPFIQIIDSPYGMSGAYMDGTERLVCSVCKEDTLRQGDERLPKFNSIFETE